MTKYPLDESGQIQSNHLHFPQGRSRKLNGVKSLALTASQYLLILIDSTSSVYVIDISKDNVTNISSLVKNTSGSNFRADNGDLYETVQTIGEQNPVFFSFRRDLVLILLIRIILKYTVLN